MVGIISAATDPLQKAAAPSFAQTFGADTLTFFDDFKSFGTVDVNNTKANGFNWYLCNFTTWQGANRSYTPAQPSWFSSGNSSLTINTANTDSNGFLLCTRCYLGSQSQWSGAVPLVSGTKPFYIEISASGVGSGPGPFSPAFWLQDLEGIARMIENRAGGARFMEIDVFETLANGTIICTAWDWSAVATIHTQNAANVGTVTAGVHTWGVLYVPMAYNGGTGFVRWYKDRAQIRTDATWTAGANLSCGEISNFAIMLANSPNHDFNIEYVAMWQLG